MLESLSMPPDAHLDQVPCVLESWSSVGARGTLHHQGLPAMVSSPRATEPPALGLNPLGVEVETGHQPQSCET